MEVSVRSVGRRKNAYALLQVDNRVNLGVQAAHNLDMNMLEPVGV